MLFHYAFYSAYDFIKYVDTSKDLLQQIPASSHSPKSYLDETIFSEDQYIEYIGAQVFKAFVLYKLGGQILQALLPMPAYVNGVLAIRGDADGSKAFQTLGFALDGVVAQQFAYYYNQLAIGCMLSPALYGFWLLYGLRTYLGMAFSHYY